jgi:hypothetical protein
MYEEVTKFQQLMIQLVVKDKTIPEVQKSPQFDEDDDDEYVSSVNECILLIPLKERSCMQSRI